MRSGKPGIPDQPCLFCKDGTPATLVIELRVSEKPPQGGGARGKFVAQKTRRVCERHADRLMELMQGGRPQRVPTRQ